MPTYPHYERHLDVIIVRFQHSFPVRVIEWLMAGITVTTGLVMAQPTRMFDNPLYEGLARIASETSWAWFAILVGMIRLAALTINGGWRPSPHVRALCAFVSCFLWFELSLGLFMAVNPSIGIAAAPWFVLAEIYSVFRASLDARLADVAAKAKRAALGEAGGDAGGNREATVMVSDRR